MHKLIESVFNDTFSSAYNTHLVGGFEEPFYKAPRAGNPALICYREDFVSSALHEVAHWCIAGAERRKQDDFGYWYLPDDRNQNQQRAFEKVEVKPQALEWLFSIASGVRFRVSADNLALQSDTEQFKHRIFEQASIYLHEGFPSRARLFVAQLELHEGGHPVTIENLNYLELSA